MSSDMAAGIPIRTFVATGVALQGPPDFGDSDDIQYSLRIIVDILTKLGYATINDSPVYTVNPGVSDLRDSLRKASRVAPIVVFYYIGHAVLENKDDFYLIAENTDLSGLTRTALPVDDLPDLIGNAGSTAELAHVLIILDCDFSTTEGERVAGKILSRFSKPYTWIIIRTQPSKGQPSRFAQVFSNAVQRTPTETSTRFLDPVSIVGNMNDAWPGSASIHYSATAPLGIPPFFPNPYYDPRLPPNPSPDNIIAFPTFDRKRLVIPAIADDATVGHPDSLGVDADARALAALVASRQLEPPLAIGLYGEWGSGKTFFMNLVQASIKDLTTNGSPEVFCSGVAPVWFSAWQYADGNLWASLLHHIFASLYPNRPRPQLALDEVMAKVQSAQQMALAVVEQVETAITRRDEAVDAIAAAEERHRKALEDSKLLRARDLWDTVTLTADDEALQKEVVSAAKDLGIPVATDNAQDVMRATREIVSLASRTRILATSGPWYRSPLAYAVYAGVIVGLLTLLIGIVVHAAHEWAGTAITGIGQLAAIGSAAVAWTFRQGGLARSLIAPAEALQRRLEDKVAKQEAKNERELVALEREADVAQTELTIALQERVAAEEQLAAAEKEQTELTGKRLLSRYLAERASSGDYDHYMGVIALAHRDLIDLEDYLRVAVSDNGSNDGIDRIVLYIDDLDRCDPDVVANVLDAVHLLLALPLFVVVVGVDPRWLKRSLRERHPDLLEQTSSGTPSTSPADYLEKIFQLTYSLPPMSPDRCADLLVASAQEIQEPLFRQDTLGPETSPASLNARTEIYDSSSGEDIQNDEVASPEGGGRLIRASAEELAEALTLHNEDINALRDIAPLVAISPRRAKRFLSIYLVVRARALGDPRLRGDLTNDGDPSSSPGESNLLVLVALLLGLPETMAAAINQDRSSSDADPVTVGTWLTQTVHTVPHEQARLQAYLNSQPSTAALHMDAVMHWLPIVRPYIPLGLAELED